MCMHSELASVCTFVCIIAAMFASVCNVVCVYVYVCVLWQVHLAC